MRLSTTQPLLALLVGTLAFGVPAVVQAGPQWSGIKGRAVLEQFILAPPLTNVVAIPTAVDRFAPAPSNYVTVRSPVKTVIRVYQAKSGRFVRTENTDDTGRFVALLQPGLYRLEPAIMRDGRVLEGDAILMGFYQLIQTAPSK